MAAKGILRIKILGDYQGLEGALKGAGKALGDFGNKIMPVSAVLAAVGGATVAAAVKFDEASDTIRAGTGATGDALKGLEQSFKNVFKTVPASTQDVAQAIADLNTRTGATGDRLEGLARQVLNLSRMTGEELGGVIASTTRVFGDWSISTDQQAGALDYLWKVSQNTGIGVTELSEKVVQFGAPLRQLGFDFETSAALIGKWEQEGVNLETVLAGMKIGLSNFAAAGIDAKEGLLQTIDAIKNAATESEATGIAMEVFGKRAGPDLAAAVREGRFDVDQLLQTVKNSSETIGKTADDTRSFSDKLVILKNKAMEAVVPLGEKLLGALDKLWPTIEKVVGWVSQAVDWFAKLPESAQNAIIIFGVIAAAAGPLLSALGPVVSALSGLGGALSSLAGAAGATGAAGAVGALSSAFVGLAAVAVAIGLAKLIYDIMEGKRASDSFHESVQKNIQALDGVTQKQKDFATASLQTAETQIKLRDSAAGIIRPLEDQKTLAAELVQAWALSGARTKEEMDGVATKVYETYDRLGAKTAEALYGPNGIVPASATAWGQVSQTTGQALDEVNAAVKEKLDVMNGRIGTAWGQVSETTGRALDEVNATVKEKFDMMRGTVDGKMSGMDQATSSGWLKVFRSTDSSLSDINTLVDEKFDLIKAAAAKVPEGVESSLSGLPDAVGRSFQKAYGLASYWAERIRSLNLNPASPGGVRAFFGAASGAVVPATLGGVPLLVGEGGEDEWVIPESKLKTMLKAASVAPSGGGRVFNVGPIYITGARAEGEQAGDALLARLAALGVTV